MEEWGTTKCAESSCDAWRNGNQNYDPDSGQQNSSSECRTMNGASVLYYNSPALDDDASSNSSDRRGLGWCLLEHATRFGELTKQAQAIERHRQRENVLYIHTFKLIYVYIHTYMFVHTYIFIYMHVQCVCALCVWNCCCCKRFYANYKIYNAQAWDAGAVLSLPSVSVYIFCVFVVCAWLA